MKRTNIAMVALLGGFVALAGAASSGEAGAPPAGDSLPGLARLQYLSAPIALSIAGHPAMLRVVRASESPQAALDAVAAAWHETGALLRRDAEGPWLNLSRIDRHGIQTLQLRRSATGGSDGYLVGWQLAGRQTAASIAHRLLPRAAITLSDVASQDDMPGRTLVAWSALGLVEVERAVLARAASVGLRRRTEGRRPDPDPARERSHHFSSAVAELAITLHREGSGTALVVHLMEPSQ